MRQARRKTNDVVGGNYLLKAKHEGAKLSWNRYEEMLPQDGFGQLGLSCHNCTQGPCRLNPFQEDSQTAICGFTKSDLVISWLRKQVKGNEGCSKLAYSLLKQLEEKGNAEQLIESKHKLLELLLNENQNNSDEIGQLQHLAKKQVELKGFVDGLAQELFGEVKDSQIKVGLGVLDKSAINVGIVGADPNIIAKIVQVAADLNQEAVNAGANNGFNVVTIGDISPYQQLNVLTNAGSAEFALLTGMLDIVILDAEYQVGNIKQVSEKYHTVIADKEVINDEVSVKDLLSQGIPAFAARNVLNIQATDQDYTSYFKYDIDVNEIETKITTGAIKGVCVLAGGSNVKLTQDQGLVALVDALASEGILFVTYGKAAVTLAKYGYFNDSNNSLFTLGSEYQVYKAFNLLNRIRETTSAKVIGVFPELVNKEDIQAAFALAGEGIHVFTCIKLPVNGSKEIANALNEIVEYVDLKELTMKVIQQFS